MENDRSLQMSPFSSLPEGCVANIILLTSPKDACRAAAVSPECKSAAESDTVWERFLQWHYPGMTSESNSPMIFSTKKELYMHLCDTGLLLEGDNLWFRVNKHSGKKCYMLCARKLAIVWGQTPEYWTWTSLPQSRFSEVAELLKVSWLDIRGRLPVQLLSPNTNYVAYLVYDLLDDHFKLDMPMDALVRFVGESITEAEGNVSVQTLCMVPPPSTRTDGWMEVELGEFSVGEENEFDVEMMLLEHKDQWWKNGLIVEGIEVRPKERF